MCYQSKSRRKTRRDYTSTNEITGLPPNIVRSRSGAVHSQTSSALQEGECKRKSSAASQHRAPSEQQRHLKRDRMARGALLLLALANCLRQSRSPQSICHTLRWRGPPTARDRDLPPIRIADFLAASRRGRCSSTIIHASGVRGTIPAQRRHEGVDRELRSMEEWETVCDHFNATLISAVWESRSCTNTFAETRPPASRHTLAAALSKAKPLRPNTPT